MTTSGALGASNPPSAEQPDSEKTEEELDEEALERFEDESPAPEPNFETTEAAAANEEDPDDTPEQPNDEA